MEDGMIVTALFSERDTKEAEEKKTQKYDCSTERCSLLKRLFIGDESSTIEA